MIKTVPNKLFFEAIEQTIKSGKQAELRVKGKSMQPFLRNGKDIVILSSFDRAELQPREIVLFPHTGRLFLHRIIKETNGHFIIQGDGVIKNHEVAEPKDIIGIVRYIIRPDGKEVDVHGFSSMLYWKVWYFMRPFRRYLLAIYNRI